MALMINGGRTKNALKMSASFVGAAGTACFHGEVRLTPLLFFCVVREYVFVLIVVVFAATQRINLRKLILRLRWLIRVML